MGSQVQATCECGFKETFSIGGGMLDSETFCAFPCLCRDCKRIVEVNLMDEPATCPDCKGENIEPYDNDALVKREGGNEVTSWMGFKLTDDPHYCPKCDSFRLRFTDTGLCFD
jgi:Zn finger protein HypA/HybF involved in hydrogenase expression